LREIVGFVGEDGGRNAAGVQVCKKFSDTRVRLCVVGPSFSVFVSDGGNEVLYCSGVEAVFGEDACYECVDAVAYEAAIGIGWVGGEFEAGKGLVGGVCDVGEGV
jgi:hypothetical protein